MSKSIVFGIAFSISCGTSPAVSEERAANFAKEAGFKATSIKCQQYDSDGNGYVTCTVFREDRDPYALECPTWDSSNACMGDGQCRVASVKVSQ